jgi:hypothetical protein
MFETLRCPPTWRGVSFIGLTIQHCGHCIDSDSCRCPLFDLRLLANTIASLISSGMRQVAFLSDPWGRGVPKAQRKAKVEPDGPLDYYRQKLTACVGYFAHSTTNTPRQADRRVNVTMPNLELIDCNLMICFKFSMDRDWWFQSTSSSHHLNQHQESRIITGTCEVICARFTLILLIAHNLFRQGYA